MQELKFKTLKDIAPLVEEYLVPEIQDSVEVCIRSYQDDDYNDMWIFGTHLWKNIWNRFESATRYEDCPFDVCGKGNEYKLKIGHYVLRHHRINQESKLPNGAKAVKAAALQLSLFSEEWAPPIEIDNIVLAIDADVENGLIEVFLGELLPQDLNSKKYLWIKKVPVWSANVTDVVNTAIVRIPAISEIKKHVAVEPIPEVTVELDNTEINKKTGEGNVEK